MVPSEKRKRFSNDFFEYLEWLEESQYWREQEIYDYKLKELQKIYQHAYTTVPFYSEKYKKAGLSLNSNTGIGGRPENTHFGKSRNSWNIGRIWFPTTIQMANYTQDKPVVVPAWHWTSMPPKDPLAFNGHSGGG